MKINEAAARWAMGVGLVLLMGLMFLDLLAQHGWQFPETAPIDETTIRQR